MLDASQKEEGDDGCGPCETGTSGSPPLPCGARSQQGVCICALRGRLGDGPCSVGAKRRSTTPRSPIAAPAAISRCKSRTPGLRSIPCRSCQALAACWGKASPKPLRLRCHQQAPQPYRQRPLAMLRFRPSFGFRAAPPAEAPPAPPHGAVQRASNGLGAGRLLTAAIAASSALRGRKQG